MPQAYAGPIGLRAHQRGVIPLRPLALGDIYDGAVKTIRSNPRATVGLALLVNLATLLPSSLVSVALVHLIGQSSSAPARSALGELVPLLLPLLFAQLAVVLLGGMLAYVVSEATLGRKAGLSQTWRAVRGRMLPLLAATVLLSVVTSLLPAAFIGLAVYGGVTHSVWTLVAGILLAVGTAFLILVPASVVTALMGPAIVLEGQGPLAGIRRALGLIRGGFWRLLGILLLTGLISGVASYILRLPFTFASNIGGMLTGSPARGSSLTVAIIASTVSYLVAGALVTPFTAAVACLLYIDRRMRVEALDVVLIRTVQRMEEEQQSRQGPAAGPPRAPSPAPSPGPSPGPSSGPAWQ